MSASQAGHPRHLARSLRFYVAALAWIAISTASLLAQSPPTILTVTPADLSQNVATNSSIVFVFDQDMTTSVFPLASLPGIYNGNFALQPTNLPFSGKWSTDKRTLTVKTTSGWPYGTNVVWTLNPPPTPGVTTGPRFKSATGQELATVSGSFTTAAPPPPPPQLISSDTHESSDRNFADHVDRFHFRPRHGHEHFAANEFDFDFRKLWRFARGVLSGWKLGRGQTDVNAAMQRRDAARNHGGLEPESAGGDESVSQYRRRTAGVGLRLVYVDQ
jgi:hypothetical protein